MKANDLGEKILVENCQCFNINSFLRKAKAEIKKNLLLIELIALGPNIKLDTSRTNLGGLRYWFKCPVCLKKVGTLFVHPFSNKIACRTCLGLEYRKRRYKGMVEAE